MAARLLGIIERIRRGRHAALARMHAGQTGLRCIRFREVVRVRGGNGGEASPCCLSNPAGLRNCESVTKTPQVLARISDLLSPPPRVFRAYQEK
jgi:hypothetical protein